MLEKIMEQIALLETPQLKELSLQINMTLREREKYPQGRIQIAEYKKPADSSEELAPKKAGGSN